MNNRVISSPDWSADLHCHSTASDGALTPEALLERAQAYDVTALALTDHDTDAGYRRLRESPRLSSDAPVLISGIELSCVWRRQTIHVVGLDFDSDSPVMRAAVERQQANREQRAEHIQERLTRAGLPDVLDRARALAGGVPGRPHFATALVEAGAVKGHQQAFSRYLGNGKAGDVKAFWPPLETIVEWIRDAGGVAVLAHPRKYRMTATRLRKLLEDFMAAGGQALEVLTSGQADADTRFLRQLCGQYGCHASMGSDFHFPGNAWCELGRLPPMPHDVKPVWELFCAATQGRIGAPAAARA